MTDSKRVTPETLAAALREHADRGEPPCASCIAVTPPPSEDVDAARDDVRVAAEYNREALEQSLDAFEAAIRADAVNDTVRQTIKDNILVTPPASEDVDAACGYQCPLTRNGHDAMDADHEWEPATPPASEAVRAIVADWFDTGYEAGRLDADVLAARVEAAIRAEVLDVATDAAWEALVADLAVDEYPWERRVVADHRPIIEAAIRAEGLDVAAIVNSFRYSKPLGQGESLRLWQRNEDTLDAILARLGDER